jgi:amidohydrolase
VAHACGHNAQLAALVGAAAALSDPEISASLGGEAEFLAIPAEEFVVSSVQERLVKEGKARFGSNGKSEFVSLGMFDGVDAAITHHVHYYESDRDVLLGSNSANGYISKAVEITGRAAHAGKAPWDGVNALNAAAIGLNALAYARETFRDCDYVRVHPIMKDGGRVVNVVPERAELEMMVRAKSLSAILDASEKVNRAFRAGALAVGAQIEIKDRPGYLPVLVCSPQAPLTEAASFLVDEAKIEAIDPSNHVALSTDVGDLTHLMPVLNFTSGGYRGGLHQADFEITDPYKAYILPAKMMALTAYKLLENGGAAAKRIKASFRPALTKEAYLDYMEGKTLK